MTTASVGSESAPGGHRRAVLVTGGRRGIGRGIVWNFAASGYDVVVNDLVDDEATAETLAGIAERGARAAFIRADIADLAAHAGLVDRAFAAFGRLDVLVNNAGVSVARRGDMLEVKPESFDRLITTNLRGPFFLTQAVARRMIEASPPPELPPRAIITVSSANAIFASPDRAEYCLAKTGLAMMTKLYAVRLAAHGIGVFEIRPGIIRTDMTAVAQEKYDKAIAEGITPIARWGEPDDVGRAAVALASGEFAFATGDAVHVDGGLHIARL
jgi:NAD(P)-dependent dehydrogenase (short-subunit alcohol dehydrogenase family)